MGITLQAFWIIYPIIFFSSIAYYLLGRYITFLDESQFWLVSRRRICNKIRNMFYDINLVSSVTFFIIMITDFLAYLLLMTSNYFSGVGK